MLRVIICLLLISFLFMQNARSQDEKPSGKITGVIFSDYYYNVARDPDIANLTNRVVLGDKDVHGFQIRRIYLGYDYKFNAKLSSRVRLESDEANFTTDIKGDKALKFDMFIKDAYVKWNYAGRHDVYFGIQSTPGFEVSESVWGNRYIEKTIMDARGIHPSRDMGIGFEGSIDSAGIFKYKLLLANGTASIPESDKYKRFSGRLDVNPLNNLVITALIDYQLRKDIANDFLPGQELANNITTAGLFIGYNNNGVLTGGVESYYRITENGNKLADSYENLNGFGVSVFATYHFSKSYNAYARFDHFEPNSKADVTGDTRNLIIVGCVYKPSGNFSISPNLLVESFEKSGGKIFKSSITPRLTIGWVF